jgi:orotate phosphoribosyltransferase
MYPYTREMSKLCKGIAEMVLDKNIEAVVGPATGGIILSQWVAYHLSELSGKEVFGTYADKDGDGFVIKRGYDEVIKGKNTLVVEDLTTTGGSIKKVVEAARAAGRMSLAPWRYATVEMSRRKRSATRHFLYRF